MILDKNHEMSYDACREEIIPDPSTGTTHIVPLGKSSEHKLPAEPVVELPIDVDSNLDRPDSIGREELTMQTHPVSPQSSSESAIQGRLSCLHPSSFSLFTQDDGTPAFCGLCFLIELWENEVPKKVHAYKELAENGKPQVAPAFWSHVEANMGLIAPKPDQNLREFRLARGQLYRPPSRKSYPLLAALWFMIGYQPKLATATIRSIQRRSTLEIANELGMSTFGAHQATAKGIRLALRTIRSFR